MELQDKFDLLDCPICQGAALLEEENGWCYYVMCLDCGAHTAEAAFHTDTEEARERAAGQVVHLWNMGKVIAEGLGE